MRIANATLSNNTFPSVETSPVNGPVSSLEEIAHQTAINAF
jgi:hypothetical protein